MEKPIKYPDLRPLTKGSSFKHVFDFLYKAGQLRYTNYEILNQVSEKVGTPKKLSKFVELGYLVSNPGDILTVPAKTFDILTGENYNCKILKPAEGEGNPHNLKVAEIVYNLTKEPDFYAVFYPNFTDLVPDFCLIRKTEVVNQVAYKIIFGEVEQEKFGWAEYLENKKAKYDKLARDTDIYEKWWKVWSENLNLPFFRLEDFCFSISCFGKIKREWGGWQFYGTD